MIQTIKIAIPMAGFGSRLRPHTWSKAKCLIPLAGKTVLDYVLKQFDTLPDSIRVEYIFIVGPQQLAQIKTYTDQNYPDKTVHYVVQEQMRGQSDALYQAREYLKGPLLMTFSDTLVEVDLSFVKDETADGVALVKPVPDPRRFGVAKLENGRVTRLVEKPSTMENNLALVGFYYFRSGEALMAAIQKQFDLKVQLKNEYFLADAINLMLENGASFRVEEIKTWLDAGMPDALFETNAYLLENGYANEGAYVLPQGVTVIPPVFIHPSAEIKSSVIGPHVSLGAECKIENVVMRDAIVDANTRVKDLVIKDSLLGCNVVVEGQAAQINVGDNSSWLMK